MLIDDIKRILSKSGPKNARSLAHDIFLDDYDSEKKREVNRLLYKYEGIYWNKENENEWTLIKNNLKKAPFSTDHDHQREKKLWPHRILCAILLHDNVSLFDFDERELNIVQQVVLDGATYTEIAAEYNLSSERIRQIYVDSIDRLRSGVIDLLNDHLTNKQRLDQITNDYNSILAENRILKRQIEDARRILSVEFSQNKGINNDHYLTKPLTELDLSVRALNSLTKSNIFTLGDLASKSSYELLQIEQFGKTTLMEVIQELKSIGLALKD